MDWLRWQNAVDLLVLSAAIYHLLLWTRRTRALRIALAILAMQAGSLLAMHFDLPVTRWVLQGASLAAVFGLLVLFQPEIRRAILRLDHVLRLGLDPGAVLGPAWRTIVDSAFAMAREGTGALIVIAGRDPVADLVDGGVTLGAEVTPAILEAVFKKTSPIHDGAIVVEADRVTHAGVVLPLTQRQDIPHQFGTRHRAAMGMAERSDALVIAVSEERGEVTLMRAREMTPVPSPDALFRLLQHFRTAQPVRLGDSLRKLLSQNLKLKFAAAGLAVMLLVASSLSTGGTVRTVSVPVEFARVPEGTEISRQSATRLEIQLRGSPLLMGSLGRRSLAARFDLRDAKEGAVTLRSETAALDLPPGIAAERVSPPAVTLHLSRHPR